MRYQLLEIAQYLRHPIFRSIELWLVIVFCTALLAGPILVLPPEANTEGIHQGPSLHHLLGTDFQGKDNLAKVIHGGQGILVVAIVAGVLTMVLAVVVGSFSGLVGGGGDEVMMGIVNIFLTMPRLPILIVCAALLKLEPDQVWMLGLLLAALGWPGPARQVRAQVLSLKARKYVEAAQMLGLSRWHIFCHEVLPNAMPFIITKFILSMTNAIYLQASWILLGLVPLSDTNWSMMVLSEYWGGALWQIDSAWSVFAPVGAIALLQLLLISLSRALEEKFNPRLQTGA